MKIISWNTNGLRATYKGGYLNDVLKEKPDILCMQETKADPEQLAEEVRNLKGYFSYFSSSKVKKGYSGVATYTKIKPEKVEYGMGIKKFDDEGRILVTYFGSQASEVSPLAGPRSDLSVSRSPTSFVLVNVYFPQGGREGRLEYKMEFYDAFLKFIDKLKKSGKNVVFCGDVNTAHHEIDLARPKENEMNTGFLPVERAWINEVVRHGYVDVYRHFYPNKKDIYTYWDMKTRARDRLAD